MCVHWKIERFAEMYLRRTRLNWRVYIYIDRGMCRHAVEYKSFNANRIGCMCVCVFRRRWFERTLDSSQE